tara:strand:- start:89 stop:271 length:183 start_codon:yes stop_codon:yes gene_type:complete
MCEIVLAVVTYPYNIWCTGITNENVDKIFERLILKNEVINYLVSSKKDWMLLDDLRKKKK